MLIVAACYILHDRYGFRETTFLDLELKRRGTFCVKRVPLGTFMTTFLSANHFTAGAQFDNLWVRPFVTRLPC